MPVESTAPPAYTNTSNEWGEIKVTKDEIHTLESTIEQLNGAYDAQVQVQAQLTAQVNDSATTEESEDGGQLAAQLETAQAPLQQLEQQRTRVRQQFEQARRSREADTIELSKNRLG